MERIRLLRVKVKKSSRRKGRDRERSTTQGLREVYGVNQDKINGKEKPGKGSGRFVTREILGEGCIEH